MRMLGLLGVVAFTLPLYAADPPQQVGPFTPFKPGSEKLSSRVLELSLRADLASRLNDILKVDMMDISRPILGPVRLSAEQERLKEAKEKVLQLIKDGKTKELEVFLEKFDKPETTESVKTKETKDRRK